MRTLLRMTGRLLVGLTWIHCRIDYILFIY
jgi:hypothetical protein